MFTIPDKNGRIDLLDQEAAKYSVPVEKPARFRNKNDDGKFEIFDILPVEMLGQIAMYLSNKDLNSFARTSQAAQYKLNGFKRAVVVDLLFESSQTEDGTYDNKFMELHVTVRSDGSAKCFRARLYDSYEVEEGIRKKTVEEFYYRPEKENWRSPFTDFYYKDFLKDHLSFLGAKNVKIGLLTLGEKLSAMDHNNIMRCFVESGLNARELQYERRYNEDGFTFPTDQFIIACNPQALSISPLADPNGIVYLDVGAFLQLGVIRQLRKLSIERVFGQNVKVDLPDGLLPQLAATHLTLCLRSRASINDVQLFLEQWIYKKREFDYLELSLSFDGESLNEMKAVVSCLDRKWAKVEKVDDDEWKLLRNDGMILFCSWFDDQIQLHTMDIY